jgi:hypothetical protein
MEHQAKLAPRHGRVHGHGNVVAATKASSKAVTLAKRAVATAEAGLTTQVVGHQDQAPWLSHGCEVSDCEPHTGPWSRVGSDGRAVKTLVNLLFKCVERTGLRPGVDGLRKPASNDELTRAEPPDAGAEASERLQLSCDLMDDVIDSFRSTHMREVAHPVDLEVRDGDRARLDVVLGPASQQVAHPNPVEEAGCLVSAVTFEGRPVRARALGRKVGSAEAGPKGPR